MVFSLLYLLWGIFYTTNDIAYWSMLPELSYDQKERKCIASLTRIVANVGLFTVVASVIPLTALLGERLGNKTAGWTAYMDVCVFCSGSFSP